MVFKENELGIVVSTMDSPSTSKITFVCTKKVYKGQYVQIEYSQGSLIGLVTDVSSQNRYFENNESVKEFESSDYNINDQFPTSDWEFLIANIKPLGVLSKENFFVRSTLPVSPGSKVLICEKEVLFKFLHLKKNGLNLGQIEFPTLPVTFCMDRLLQKHLAILAQSGAGKSYLTSVVLEELLDRTKEEGQVAILLFDVHGEYSHFSHPIKDSSQHKDYSSKTIKINSFEIKIGVSTLSLNFFSSLLPSLSSAQKRELGSVLKKLNEDKKNGLGPFDLKDIIKEIERQEVKENVSKPLINALGELLDYHLFAKIDSPSIFDIVKPGKLTIIDLSREINLKKKQLILYYFAHKLFYSRTNPSLNVPPFLLVVEEAHQFAPESASKDRAMAKSILETIAREGRKFGSCLCLISQRPVKLSTTVLSQANTHIILRITNPYDLKHIGESSEGLDSKSVEMITSLRVGEALVVGEASSYPVFFKVRKKYSQDSHLDVSLSGLAKNYLKNTSNQEKDIEGFL
ncbi:ATP-binding protein [archaeon]|nr:ATP-binding protein [archaeon]NCP79651.1 ATP-binding protein [archaeon]NCP97941.1 ATP-binding protein [archaeon]NCQ07417.1 ATP-binding protein [archaeon]NCQ51208.1 ATP-binding protein [archaeon]